MPGAVAPAANDLARAGGAAAGAAATDELTRQWQDAVDDASRPRISDYLGQRELAFLIGVVWFCLALRHQLARRRRVA